MEKTTKVILAVAIILLVFGVWAISKTEKTKKERTSFSAALGMLIEDYVPYVRYNNGIKTGLSVQASSTLMVTGATTLFATTTQNALSGNCAYEKKGPVGAESEYAFCTVAASATSSVPFIQPNPFGSATSTLLVDETTLAITVGLTGANTLSISTTSNSVGYGSSTPAIALDISLPTGGQVYYGLKGNSATSTGAIVGAATGVLPGQAPNGLSNYVIGPNVFTTGRIATSSPGTFGTYATGNLYVVYKKQ